MPCTYREDAAEAPAGTARTASLDAFVSEVSQFKRSRRSGACVACRVDKKACEGPGGDGGACERCRNRGFECVFPGKEGGKGSPDLDGAGNRRSPRPEAAARPKSKPKKRRLSMTSIEGTDSVDSPDAATAFHASDVASPQFAAIANSNSAASQEMAVEHYSPQFSSSSSSQHASPYMSGTPFGSVGASPPLQPSMNVARTPSGSIPISFLILDQHIPPVIRGYSQVAADPVMPPRVPMTLPWAPLSLNEDYSNTPLAVSISNLNFNAAPPDIDDPLSAVAAIPRNPAFRSFPSPAAINKCVQIYFEIADITFVMLHRVRFQSSQPSSLLLASILLAAPYMTTDPIPGYGTREQTSVWDKPLFQVAKTEMLAFLGSGGNVTIEVVAAVMNLHCFAIHKGLTVLSARLLGLARKLCAAMALVQDAESFAAPEEGILSFRETVEHRFGADADIFSSPLSLPQIAELRELWIDYWTRERVVWLVIVLTRANRDWTRGVGKPLSTPTGALADLRRPITPTCAVWEASFDLLFDPRTVPDPPLMSDCLLGLLMDSADPARPAALATLSEHIISGRKLVPFCFYVLRDRVDLFLQACRDAGLATPAGLPIDPAAESDPKRLGLIQMREEINDAINACREAFPESVKSALKRGSASDVLAALMAPSGSFYYSFNHVTFIPAINLLRLELYSSCGVYLTMQAVQGAGEDWTEQDTLADEFGTGGALFAEFLEDVLLFTRLIEEWRLLNPDFKNHIESSLTLVFRICLLHTSFYKKFKRSTLPGRSMDVLTQVERDMRACLDVLALYARRTPWAMAVYNLARKTVSEHRISVLELQEARQAVDFSRRPSLTGEPMEVDEDEAIEDEARQLQGLLGVYEHVGISRPGGSLLAVRTMAAIGHN